MHPDTNPDVILSLAERPQESQRSKAVDNSATPDYPLVDTMLVSDLDATMRSRSVHPSPGRDNRRSPARVEAPVQRSKRRSTNHAASPGQCLNCHPTQASGLSRSSVACLDGDSLPAPCPRGRCRLSIANYCRFLGVSALREPPKSTAQPGSIPSQTAPTNSLVRRSAEGKPGREQHRIPLSHGVYSFLSRPTAAADCTKLPGRPGGDTRHCFSSTFTPKTTA